MGGSLELIIQNLKMNNMNKLSINNLSKPDNQNLKQIAIIALYTLPLVTVAIASAPLPDSILKWLMVVLNLTIVGFKAFSKFTTNTVEVNADVVNTEQSNLP
jgi:hypothetical protein